MWQPFLFLNPKFSSYKSFFTVFPKLHFFLSKILMTFFSHHPFFIILCPSVFSYFTHDESYSSFLHPIHIFCTLYTPYIHTHMLFSRFYTLVCALVTVDTAYTIFFFLIQPFITAHFRSLLHILCITAHLNKPWSIPNCRWYFHICKFNNVKVKWPETLPELFCRLTIAMPTLNQPSHFYGPSIKYVTLEGWRGSEKVWQFVTEGGEVKSMWRHTYNFLSYIWNMHF